jgi:MoaA/NifB/PqqE/SkfB family radical SAM enzyme
VTDARPSALLLAERAEADSFLPHVVAWNLTKRCNLRCSHCYISAGPFETAESELTTAECHRVIDELLAVNPSPMLILSGGEPLVRQDLEEIASHASGRGATVVVGTNGTTLSEPRVAMLKRAGVSGVAVSVDSLDEGVHDHFRGGAKALERTKEALSHLREQRIDVVVQTTATPRNVAEIPALLEWAAEEGAVCFNLYFLVPDGRGVDLLDLAPQRIETLLAELAAAETRYRGRMMVRAKCAPHFMRHVHAADPGLAGAQLPHALPLRHRLLPHHARRQAHAVPVHAVRGRATCAASRSARSGRARRSSPSCASASSEAVAAAASTAWCAAAAGRARWRRPATTSRRTQAASTSRPATGRSSSARTSPTAARRRQACNGHLKRASGWRRSRPSCAAS